MNRYKLSKEVGDGTYGKVLLGTRLDTNELVAIKQLSRTLKIALLRRPSLKKYRFAE